MDPITASILIGAAASSAYMSYEQGQKQNRAVEQEQKRQRWASAANQNALVEKGFANRGKGAAGLGMSSLGRGAAGGLGASQTGTVLTSVTGESKNNLLG